MASDVRTRRTRDLVDPLVVGWLLVPVAVVVLWKATSVLVGATVLPGPVQTAGIIQDGVRQGWIIDNLRGTLVSTAVAFTIALVLGFLPALALGLYRPAYDLFEEYILSAYAIPKISLFPIFLFLFGTGLNTQIAFGVAGGFFPMIVITMSAVRSIDDVYLEVSRSLRLSRWQLLRYVVVPFILVQLTVALRLCFSATFLSVILAELFNSSEGIGNVLQHAIGTFDSERLTAIVVVLTLVAFVGNVAFYWMRRTLEERWNIGTSDIQEGAGI